MREVGACKARRTLAQLLDEVERGEQVTITRHGMPVARLVPATTPRTGAAARQVVEELRAFRTGRKLRGLSIKKLIAEGRR